MSTRENMENDLKAAWKKIREDILARHATTSDIFKEDQIAAWSIFLGGLLVRRQLRKRGASPLVAYAVSTLDTTLTAIAYRVGVMSREAQRRRREHCPICTGNDYLGHAHDCERSRFNGLNDEAHRRLGQKVSEV